MLTIQRTLYFLNRKELGILGYIVKQNCAYLEVSGNNQDDISNNDNS